MSNDAGRKQFWRRNVSRVPGSIQHVYGAQHPPFDPQLHGTLTKSVLKHPTTPVKLKKTTTFQEFESNTSDAWDVGEDDDELLAMAAENLNSNVVMETAKQVIQNHTKLQEQSKHQASQQEEESFVLDETQSLSSHENKIGKSASESSIPKISGEKHTLQRQQSVPQQTSIPVMLKMADQAISCGSELNEREAFRVEKFKQLLAGPNTDLDELRKLSWSGVPKSVRSITWKLLTGYLPANVERRESTLKRKQKEYFAFIEQYYSSRNDDTNQSTYRQIHIDVPRMSPESLILQPVVTEVFERILFIWAIRHPASGYVQGINDLVTPFFVVFLSDYIDEEVEVENADVSSLPEEVLRNIEADSYWCMSKLLDGIQDNYTFAQPGIQRKVKMLEELVSRIDDQVHSHLQQYEVEYLQFAFRWMNNLLMRELPLRCTIRLWDTYQGLLIFLQNLPTEHWKDEDMSVLLAEAYRLKFAFADAPNHYKK
ncbi:TBC1 domain family member 22A isoform X2 [Xenopus tropicalis]|uniref:TBC1 domain family member 22A n=1 Tax=Xenopus tropicalis TaxID=8364 RepID=A0A6I8SDF1_XENTR|nr:TBC1 domain family member 22A isoform X2 [Xenopus tropicalis]|eukprot:XP_017947796.1 PREDICTED: TBC1 domain family member 22A isoform X3 [Xenopus tropicalis]